MSVRRFLAPLLMLFILAGAAPALAQDKVVYHIDNAAEQGTKALRNIRNHLDVAPKTEIRVVTHAEGIDLLMEGAKDQKNNIDYAPLISDLKGRGVHFEVCEITIKRRNLNKDQFVMDAEFTPSGVVRITELQARDHYAYIKP
ncbi:DsrE family protein [Azospirillum sp. YIM B02556]|uniref:DsrE family protein n=1 Tax=Azospirillum endophyticum TaxID=2800326 RepID=A0ABS1F5Y4_9PROT|nr:DsrE family protein [Azospirillum endophyticum]MBK1838697.1 DsrE family protein [Azospirillum endophyticum]